MFIQQIHNEHLISPRHYLSSGGHSDEQILVAETENKDTDKQDRAESVKSSDPSKSGEGARSDLGGGTSCEKVGKYSP